jgi:hypothetical protein
MVVFSEGTRLYIYRIIESFQHVQCPKIEKHGAGDGIALRAQMDLIVSLTACFVEMLKKYRV